MFKRIHNHEGSTLIMVIIMVAVLTVLGSVLLSVTLMNINMKYNDKRAKVNMYYSESGIDEVYAFLGDKVQVALNDAKTQTDNYMIGFTNFVYATIHDPDVTNDGKVDNGEVIVSADGSTHTVVVADGYSGIQFLYVNGQLDRVQIENVANSWYKKSFIKIMTDTVFADTTVLKNQLKALNGLVPGPLVTVSVGNINVFTDHFEILDVVSTYTENNVEKQVSVDIQINPPAQYPIAIEETNIAVTNNPIWQNALVANNDIIFDATEVNVDGDVIAVGTRGVPVSTAGIMMIKDSSKVTINGDMVSNAYIQTAADNTSLTLNKGLIYCNSLVTNKEAKGSEIIVNQGNVYTDDDLELNGENSKIIIDGSYYGMSKGNGGPNQSSSIIINATLGTTLNPAGAMLQITGTDPGLPNGESSANAGVWIPGSSYIDIQGETAYFPYQTGESVSIKGNYMVYTEAYNPGVTDDQTATGTLSGGGDMILVVKKKLPDGTLEVMDSIDKNEFFLDKAITGPYKDDIVKGSTTTLSINNVKYAVSTYINSSGDIVYDNTLNVSEYATLQKTLRGDFSFYLMTTRNRTASDPNPEDAVVKYQDGSTVTKDPVNNNLLDKWIETTGTSTFQSIGLKPYIRDSSQTANEVMYYSPNASDVTLTATGITINGVTTPTSLSRYQGIIVTQGNVTLSGVSEFAGTIIAGGKITISGGNTKIFNKDAVTNKYIQRLIYENEMLTNIFNKNKGLDPVVPFMDDNAIQISPNTNIDSQYKDIIKLDHWQVN